MSSSASSVRLLLVLNTCLPTAIAGIRGTVVRVSAIQPLVTRLNFRCARCDTVVEKVFEGGVYEPLTK